VRSWKWRVEAWRTGKTFAEVVLLRTLVYRVEQLLLVDRGAGLLLASVAASDVIPRDSQLISAMLTALQDFVIDSFQVNAEVGIREIHVGDFTLLVETGPRAALAAAVRGNAPADVRETLRAAIDLIHQEFVIELRNFRDNAEPFERSRTILEGCLQAQYQKRDPPSYTRLWILAAAILVVLAAWIGLRIAENRRWEGAIAALRNAQGIAITRADRGNGRYILEGLSDPLAGRPETTLRNSGIDLRRVSLHFQPYLSLDPELVVKRARMVLNAPDAISASLDNGILRVAGTAPHSWIIETRSAGAKLIFLGIRGVAPGAITDADMEALRGEIESNGVLFDVDSSVLTADQMRAGKVLAAKTRQWVEYAGGIGRTPRLILGGYADPTGTHERNLVLSRQRAEHLAELLVAAGIAPGLVSVESLSQPTDKPPDPALQRRAVIRLRLSDAKGTW
jgi:OOP family OmpA-OmpF porin